MSYSSALPLAFVLTHVAATMRENLGFVLKDNDCEATQTGELNPK